MKDLYFKAADGSLGNSQKTSSTHCFGIYVINLDRFLSKNFLWHEKFFFSFTSPHDLLLEGPLETSAILSLCGMASLIVNQWNTTIHANMQNLKLIFAGKFSRKCLDL